MGLEVATYIGGLTPSWPLSGDTKSQGDDHIRLLKAALQATFPNANKPWYFPTTEAATANMVLDATDNNNELLLDTTSGALTVTLPATLGANDKGFKVTVVKTSTDANGILVSAAANIASKVGSTATIRVGTPYEPAYFTWNGSAWYCTKPGTVVGEVLSFDGTTTPPGFLDMDGSVYSNTTFAELFAVLATTTLRDRRGRLDIGAGTGSGLTNRVAGTTYGAESVQLAVANLPAETPAGTINTPTVTTNSGDNIVTNPSVIGNATPAGGGAGLMPTAASSFRSSTLVCQALTFTGTPFPGRSQTAFGILPPTIGAKRIIRAC